MPTRRGVTAQRKLERGTKPSQADHCPQAGLVAGVRAHQAKAVLVQGQEQGLSCTLKTLPTHEEESVSPPIPPPPGHCYILNRRSLNTYNVLGVLLVLLGRKQSADMRP